MNRRYRIILTVLILSLVTIQQASANFFDCTKEPYASSPACKGEHPRLFLTNANIQPIRDKIASQFKAEYQSFINQADKLIAANTTDRYYTTIQNFALIYKMGVLPGFSYKYPIDTYGTRAKEWMMWATAIVYRTVSGYHADAQPPETDASFHDGRSTRRREAIVRHTPDRG